MGSQNKHPRRAFLIITNNFFDSLGFYGMKAIVIFYLWKELNVSKANSASMYHLFSIVNFGTAIFGATFGDGKLGKMRTIMLAYIIYIGGLALLILSTIPLLHSRPGWLTYVSLFMASFGSGCIRPNMYAIGGDQYNDHQSELQGRFFSTFYLITNIGMLCAAGIPYLKESVYCFENQCYTLCFGLLGASSTVGAVVFFLGSKKYIKHKFSRNMIVQTAGCIWLAWKKILTERRVEKKHRKHWLYAASPEYEEQTIRDIMQALNIAFLYLPLPFFWAVFELQYSKWTFQAQQMNGDLGFVFLYPEMIIFLNPIFIMAMIPFFDYVFAPFFKARGLPINNLQKLTAGIFLAGLSCLISAALQLHIDAGQPLNIKNNLTKLQLINTLSTETSCQLQNHSAFPITAHQSTKYLELPSGSLEVICNHSDSHISHTSFHFEGGSAQQLFLISGDSFVLKKQKRLKLLDKGESSVRVFNALPQSVDVRFTSLESGVVQHVGEVRAFSLSQHLTLEAFNYKVEYNISNDCDSIHVSPFSTKNGAVSTIVLSNATHFKTTVHRELEGWSVSVLLQIPQYLVVTVAECVFATAGIDFAYSQAPKNMKSLMSACWLLTLCGGNAIIILITLLSTQTIEQATELFVFTAITFFMMIIFAIMAKNYKKIRSNRRTFSQICIVEQNGDKSFMEEGVNENDYEVITSNVIPYELIKISAPIIKNRSEGKTIYSDDQRVRVGQVSKGFENFESSFGIKNENEILSTSL